MDYRDYQHLVFERRPNDVVDSAWRNRRLDDHQGTVLEDGPQLGTRRPQRLEAWTVVRIDRRVDADQDHVSVGEVSVHPAGAQAMRGDHLLE